MRCAYIWILMSAFILTMADMSSVTSINNTDSCLFTKIDYTLKGNSIDEFSTVVQTDDYYYAAGYSYSTGITNGQNDMVVYKIQKSDGSQIWGKYYGTDRTEKANSIAVPEDDSYVVAVGVTEKTGSQNGLVAKFTGSNGSLGWYKVFGDSGVQVLNSVKIFYGAIYVVGYLSNFGSGNFADAWVMKLDQTSGSTTWSKRYGAYSYDFGIDLALDINTSRFWMSASTQSQTLRNGGTDFLLFRLATDDGAYSVWRYFGTTSAEVVKQMITDSNNENLFIAGTTDDVALSNGLVDFLVVKYSLSSGSISWAGVIGTSQDDILESIIYYDTDSTREGIYLLGYSSGFAGTLGSEDAIVIKLNSNSLAIEWQMYFGTSEGDYAYHALVNSASGSLIMVGRSANNAFIYGVDFEGKSQCTNLGVNIGSDIFILISLNTTVYKFTDGVPATNEAVSTSVSVSQTLSSLTLGTVGTNLTPVCSSYIPVQPLDFPSLLVAPQSSDFNYSVPIFCYSPQSLIKYTITQDDDSALPSWLKFNETAFSLEGSPIEVAEYEFIIKFKVALASDNSIFTKVQIPFYVNRSPVVSNSLSNINSRTGANVIVEISSDTFTDPDGDDITISIINIPSWMTYSNNQLKGTPDFGDIGSKTIYVKGEDTYGGTVTDSFKISITKNYFPVQVTKFTTQTIPKNVAYSYTVPESYFSDANNDELFISMDNTDYSWLSLDTSTWILSGTPTKDYEYNVTLSITDGFNAYLTAIVNIIVGTGIPNNAPVVNKTISTILIYTGESFSKSLETAFYDADNDPLSYQWTYSNGSNLESWMLFDQLTMTLYGKVPLKNELSGLTIMELTLTVRDPSDETASQDFIVKIDESSNNILTLIIAIIVGIVLFAVLVIILFCWYKYWYKSTKNKILTEKHLEANKEHKEEKQSIDDENFDNKLSSDRELNLETQRELRDTENAPSSAIDDEEDDENELEFIENVAKYMTTGSNFNQENN